MYIKNGTQKNPDFSNQNQQLITRHSQQSLPSLDQEQKFSKSYQGTLSKTQYLNNTMNLLKSENQSMKRQNLTLNPSLKQIQGRTQKTKSMIKEIQDSRNVKPEYVQQLNDPMDIEQQTQGIPDYYKKKLKQS